MKSRYIILTAVISTLAVAMACGDTDSPETVPVALPTQSPSLEAEPLSASDLEALDEFVGQQEAVERSWDRFQQEFDQWRAGLNSCHPSSVQEALQDFAVGFNAVTERARDLPRASVTHDMADTLIAAAEAEAGAFRQLRDRWQPNSPSLFEAVERQRAQAGRARNRVLDRATALREDLERLADPQERRILEDFSQAFDLIRDDWEEFHDDYADLLREAAATDESVFLAGLPQLIQQFGAVSTAITRLPTAHAVQEIVETLEDTADAEFRALTDLYRVVALAAEQAAAATEDSDAEQAGDGEEQNGSQGQNGQQRQNGAGRAEESGPDVGPFLVAVDTAIVVAETTLKEVSRGIHQALDQTASRDLERVRVFIGDSGDLAADWKAFYERYDEWRRTEGGCDREAVLQSLVQFNTRIVELGRQVRDLPQSGYLLPIHNLLVQAVEREEGAIRALRNTWQPFTVDAFIAVDRERDNANRLRREASIALRELRDRS